MRIGLYDNYPRRYGKSREILYEKKSFLENVNRDNGYSDVFVSVYHYDTIEERNGIYRLDPESAVIDKVFVDMDFKDFIDYEEIFDHSDTFENDVNDKKLETILSEYEKIKIDKAKDELYVKIMKLEEILDKKEILRIWCFSGGGFHLYVYINNNPENKKPFIRNALNYLSKQVFNKKETYIDRKGSERKKKLWDPKCPLKLSQMARVIGTYNPKRKLFCYSLTKDDMKKGLEHILQKAKKQNNKINYLGNKLLKLPNHFDEEVLEKCSSTIDLGITQTSNEIKEILESYCVFWKEVPLCMRTLLHDKDLYHTERYLLITFLYRCGLSKNEIGEVLRVTLSAKKLYHCCGILKDNYKPTPRERSRIENQISNTIDNDYYISCKQIRQYGLCNQFCEIGDVLFYFS